MVIREIYLGYNKARDVGTIKGLERGSNAFNSVREKMFRWCDKAGVVIIGGTSLDLNFKDSYGVPYYPPDHPGDLDIKIERGKLDSSFDLLKEMLKEDGEVEVMISGSAAKGKLNGILIVEAGIITKDLFDRIPIKRVSVEVTKGETLKVNVVHIDSFLAVYFAIISFSHLLNASEKLGKVLRSLTKVSEVLTSKKGFPTPIKFAAMGEFKLAEKELLEKFPLPKDCVFTGRTAIALFEGKRVMDDQPVEIASFTDSGNVMEEYIHTGGYEGYEMELHWQWWDQPARLYLEGGKRGLTIFDCSTLCGQRVSNTLSPIGVAGLSHPDLATKILSSINANNKNLISLLRTKESIGRCFFGPYIAREGDYRKIDRTKYLSSIRYVAAVAKAMVEGEHDPRPKGKYPTSKGGPSRGMDTAWW